MHAKACRPEWVFLLLPLLAGCGDSRPRVVLYCAQDPPFAESLLADFTRNTGVEVASKFDTEADKSVSLYEALVREKAHPRCDVFWNNEILHVMRLRQHGLLEPYASPAAATYPDWTRPADQTWQAFAARARILLVNTKVPAAERPRLATATAVSAPSTHWTRRNAARCGPNSRNTAPTNT